MTPHFQNVARLPHTSWYAARPGAMHEPRGFLCRMCLTAAAAIVEIAIAGVAATAHQKDQDQEQHGAVASTEHLANLLSRSLH